MTTLLLARLSRKPLKKRVYRMEACGMPYNNGCFVE